MGGITTGGGGGYAYYGGDFVDGTRVWVGFGLAVGLIGFGLADCVRIFWLGGTRWESALGYALAPGNAAYHSQLGSVFAGHE